MALLTALPFDDASELLKNYGLILLDLQALKAGSVNSNFFLSARNSTGAAIELFARIYEEQGNEGAQFELTLNEVLFEEGIAVARPVRLLSGESFLSYGQKPFALYQRLEGEVLCQGRVTELAAQSVGAALASVHCASLGGLQVEPSRFGFAAIEERLVRVEEAQRADLYPALQTIRDLVQLIQSERDLSLPQGLIHGDLFRDNVLMQGENVSGLLDFESASAGPYVYDLMVTLLAWCFGDTLDGKLARAMVKGYCKVRPLSQQERAGMVLEGSVACARFASTRLTDFSLRTSAGKKPSRQYTRFFDRLAALRAGALDEALAGLEFTAK